MNLGQILSWISFLASIVAGLGFLAAAGGREGGGKVGRVAFRVQWFALLASTAFLWLILFNHQFQFQYVANYSSRSMPWYYVYAALWGGQEGTFLLWALITATLGLLMMRGRGLFANSTMLFLNLPLVLLGLVTAMRGPFLMWPNGGMPPDGQGLNPLLQDPWMTIHPPVLFIGFSSLVAPFAIGMSALVHRDYDGWVKRVLPWCAFSAGILATGFIMGGVWAYKVLGWGGYWGWDPVENGSLIPWLCNMALLHGLLVQRATGSLRRTNFFLAITSYVLVLYASFLTRSGVLADFSVHSFANLGLSGFLLSFLLIVLVTGYGALLWRMRDIPKAKEPLGSFSRESMMWLGQLVFMLMTALITVGMSAPLLTRLWGPPSNVQTSYYNLVNAPLAIALGLLLGSAPLMRWRHQDPRVFLSSVLPALGVGLAVVIAALLMKVQDLVPLTVLFGAGFALGANVIVTARGFRSGWKHGLPYLAHSGVAILLIGVIASSNYGASTQVQLPRGQSRNALGYALTYQGVRTGERGQDQVVIAVQDPSGNYEASPKLYWSEFNQAYMKKPHIQRHLTHDVYISPLEMVGQEEASRGVWFRKGESKKIGEVLWTFVDFDRQMGDVVRVAARMRAEIGGRTVPVRPILEMKMGGDGVPNRIPDYLPGGASVQILSVDPNTGSVQLELPGMGRGDGGDVLAVEISTKPLINLVWAGAIVMLAATFLSMIRRIIDQRRSQVAAAKA
ncbi:MAG: cytochrome c biogenesis protein CcsA [Candidatus Eisenbacteria bacterium]|uniref:Cytochrome c biogenesis protein CcsA n=1 Tax=Eiseniibacteriota bacterium TaxID=2212470 RepID=A0A849SEI5_UNCEI|nr:cytochrome c biogenesis protein CcsA [Candidatus Eisenbacteria bacterium]